MLKDSQFESAIVRWLDEYAPRGYITTDRSLIIRGWNRWLETRAGFAAQEVIGRPLFEVFPELAARQLDRLYQDALRGQVAVLANRFHKYLIKLPVASEYGLTEMPQSAFIGPLVHEGDVIGTITSIDDVTDRVAHENELLIAREEADKANDAKDRFIAMLSHDLRTPLTAVLGWARVLLDRPADEKIVQKGAEVIERNVRVQLELIEQVLDISRISSAKLELDLEWVDVREALQTALESIEPIAQAKGIRVDRDLMAEQRTASLDAKRFQQVIWNLVSNALKFTPNGGSIRVSLKNASDAFHMIVADTGKGISAEHLPHLFEPLWQAEESTGHGGLGLGLAIVRNLVELHGGTIRAESPGAGLGAVFTVQIPWARPHTRNESAIQKARS
jgi:PAS domain S-box-containing protein